MAAVRAIPVLMYHSVTDVVTDGFREFTVTPDRFAEHLVALREAGWRTVSVSEALTQLRGRTPAAADDRVVAITFDDGLADFHAGALPLLAAEDSGATLFVPTAHVGGTARWLDGAEARRPLLSWPALAEVMAAGVEVGSHGHLHAPLDVAAGDGAYQDLVRSRGLLEDRLGVEVRTLAFPFGYQTRRSRRAAQRAGFRAAWTVVGLPTTARDRDFALPRLAAKQNMSGSDLVTAVGRRYPAWERSWRFGKQDMWSAARKMRVVGR